MRQKPKQSPKKLRVTEKLFKKCVERIFKKFATTHQQCCVCIKRTLSREHELLQEQLEKNMKTDKLTRQARPTLCTSLIQSTLPLHSSDRNTHEIYLMLDGRTALLTRKGIFQNPMDEGRKESSSNIAQKFESISEFCNSVRLLSKNANLDQDAIQIHVSRPNGSVMICNFSEIRQSILGSGLERISNLHQRIMEITEPTLNIENEGLEEGTLKIEELVKELRKLDVKQLQQVKKDEIAMNINHLLEILRNVNKPTSV